MALVACALVIGSAPYLGIAWTIAIVVWLRRCTSHAHLAIGAGALGLSIIALWLTADGPARREKAESVILAGIARERRMWRKGKGFSMYPEQREVHAHYSPLVVRHLLRTPKEPALKARLATIPPAADTVCPFCGAQLLMLGSQCSCPVCGVVRG